MSSQSQEILHFDYRYASEYLDFTEVHSAKPAIWMHNVPKMNQK